ncbi:MAG: type II toxin-antitoxin system HicB family antitoxin [Oscillospiraceae bacterium]|nr:type II toxin-antitoxin system HicB family antitoxin [Oscillospiraceae bacterium]
MKQVRHVYPAIFTPEEGYGFCIIFPDIRMGATQGKDIAEGMVMAEDFLASAICKLEDIGDEIPNPTDINSLKLKKGDIATLISVDVADYRRRTENKFIKKTLTIPSWLNALAEDSKINFSQTLQQALKEKLNV